MAIIRIKNFGPIGEKRSGNGQVEGDGCFTLQISSVCLFVGYQASGKSTVAKLYSIFVWLEKTLQQGAVAMELNSGTFRTLCYQQEIGEYFSQETFLSYEGEAYAFEYDGGRNEFSTTHRGGRWLSVPKIQYVSAARNLLSILYRISTEKVVDTRGNILELSSNIPYMVRSLNVEYLNALEANRHYGLPIEATSVDYSDHNVYITTHGRRLSMSAASSGIQSVAPLLVVSRYLSNEVQKSLFEKLKNLSTSLKQNIERKLENEDGSLVEKFNLYCMGGSDLLGGANHVEHLEEILNSVIPSNFVNIVEEPEQNLFPETQAEVLYELLECKNASKGNRLVIATHSPYVLMAVNNAIMAHKVFAQQGKTIAGMPTKRMVADISAYMFANGGITSIVDEESGLIDAESIDSCSTQINEVFDQLLDMSDE